MSALSDPLLRDPVFPMFSPDVGHRIVFLMDFPALMKFRALCRASFDVVDSILQKEFYSILAEKVPKPAAFHDALDEHDVYVGSFSALAFFLRQRFHIDTDLELFVPRAAFDLMRQHLLEVQRAVCVSDKPVGTITRGVIRVSEWRTPSGSITLYRSMVNDALYPILRGTSTAMMVYANPVRFGVIWPKLTFNLRMMPGPLSDAPESYMPIFRMIGFTIHLYPWMWNDMGLFQTCAADRFLCPAQPRYIHDAGSFRGTWHPGSVDPLIVAIVAVPSSGFQPLVASYSYHSLLTPIIFMSDSLKTEADADDTIVVDKWVTNKQVRKFRRFLTWVYAPKIRYSLSMLPSSADWGTRAYDVRFLCYRGEPVTICVVGAIHGYTLSCEKGSPSRVEVTLDLLRNGDRDVMVRLLDKSQPPPRVVPELCKITLKQDSGKKKGFDAVYNAIDGFSTTYSMPEFQFSALKSGDIVMAETLLRRDLEVDGTWDVGFELSTLSVLALSPRDN
ncbi:hypothetical protein GSI_02250 [Ganoderma sinense ZZ0214-1]|uniref:Uncharacterized protein n=1 Tax=Ganoderma sinense ZZ0214-1 TaxID=1077348 RepID=A0A2G8SP49_9APHY|nr:hypothetical protein GSI_02250 [Ganoderma sinense ZZ0214-1]